MDLLDRRRASDSYDVLLACDRMGVLMFHKPPADPSARRVEKLVKTAS